MGSAGFVTRSRFRLALAVVLTSGLTACDSGPTLPSIEWVEGDGLRSRSLDVRGERGGRFTPMEAQATGLVASASMSRDEWLANRTLTHGTGVALGDVDGDGWVDVYVPLLDAPNVLYRNLGGWRFEDVTASSGTALAEHMSRGAVLADADGDGDLDLFVAVHGGTNQLLLNDGAGVFEVGDPGFVGTYGTTTLALADVDGDSDLDVYFANYKVAQGDDLFSPADRTLEQHVTRVGDDLVIQPPYDEHYRLQRVGDRVLRFELADPDEFYLNDGSGRFEAVDLSSDRFVDSSGDPIATTPRDWGLVARFFDADDDGDPDLYVANDFGSRDGFWINEGGRFRAASGLELRTTSASSMGVDFSDVDGDGDTDFVTTEMLALDPVRRREQATGLEVERTPPGRFDIRAPAGRNALQLNRGDGTFAEVGQAAGVSASEWTWGAMFLDVDLDGRQDLLITNGHAWDPLDGDTQDDLRSGRVRVDWRQELGIFPELRLHNVAFRNLGDGAFGPADPAWRYGVAPDISHGIAAADLDRDGDRDVLITRLNEPPLALRNDAGGARVAVRVRSVGGGAQAIGARVTLEGGAATWQTRQVSSGGAYLSGSEDGLTFAMADSDSATVTVTWPSGLTRRIPVEPNRLYEISPTGAVPGEFPRSTEAGAASTGGRWFAPPQVAGRHVESEFDELGRQPLLPLELGRMGPGISWEDIDGDGDPDLLTSNGAGSRTAAARAEGDRLLDPIAVGAFAPGDQTSVLSIPGRAGPTMLAGVSSWEARTPDDIASIPAFMALSRAGAPPIPSVGASGPLAAADIDGDGDLDLFLGTRAVPGGYPRPASSRFLLQDAGSWIVDTTRSSALAQIGMVSSAVFSDVDGDGDPDLILALDWGPVRLLLNQGSRFRDVTDAWGLGALPGRWNGVATGDLNGDGRPDLVATGWGNNTGSVVSSQRPAGIYAADLDGNGLVDIIETRTDASGLEAPVRDYLTLSTHVPSIRRGVPTFERFARSGIDELLGPSRAQVYSAHAVTFEHTVFMNTGAGFESRSLPAASQRAPAFGVVVADFDRDGREDLFLAQNFLATPAGLSRFDAGRGAILRGDGAGGFVSVEADVSGIVVYGDARGAAVADYDADGRWDLAVGQNGGETLVFRGAGGDPGLRVRLAGEAANPAGVGAAIRVGYDEGEGPAREVQSGSGYWSKNGSTQVFGRGAEARSVHVRWPDGLEERFPVPTSALEVVLRRGRGTP